MKWYHSVIIITLASLCGAALGKWVTNDLNRRAPVIITHPTEYHFNVDQTGYDIYTEDMKLVGRLKYGDNRTLDSLINADNQ